MALAVDRYELGPIGTNCYLVRTERGAAEAVLIDPGDDATQLRLELAGTGVTIAAILVTHTHYDHIGAVAEVAEATGAPVYISETEARVLADPDAYYPGMRIRGHVAEHQLTGEETLELAGIDFQTLPVPGHSPGHIAFYSDGSLFSGDVLFQGSVGRVDLPFGDWDTLIESIRSLLDRLPPETVVYSGHGPPTTLADERARNPFLAELRA